MTKPSNQSYYEALYRVAEQQAGYFTTHQALAAGYSQRQLTYQVRTGRFVRMRPGVYRVSQFPASRNGDLFLAWLEAGASAVISHTSALALYGLSDALPAKTELTVSRTASRRHPGLRLHTKGLSADEVTTYEGLPVTTVARTIVDVAVGGLAGELVMQAVQEAVERGLVTVDDLQAQAARHGGRAQRLIEQVLQERVA